LNTVRRTQLFFFP